MLINIIKYPLQILQKVFSFLNTIFNFTFNLPKQLLVNPLGGFACRIQTLILLMQNQQQLRQNLFNQHLPKYRIIKKWRVVKNEYHTIDTICCKWRIRVEHKDQRSVREQCLLFIT